MKRSLKNLISLVILFSVICMIGTVNAASTSMSLTSDSKLIAGNTVTVILKITNIDAGEGIDALKGTLNYDKNIFEDVTIESFEGINRWSIMDYNPQTGIFTAIRSPKVNMQSDVLKVTLKAKNAITVNSSIVEIKDITVSGGAVEVGGTGDIVVQPVNVTINKVSEINPDPEKPNTNEQTNSVTTNKINGNEVKGNNVPNTKLPQTGEEYGIVFTIAVVAIISIIAYIRYRNVNIK